jgi:hypothetical protein
MRDKVKDKLSISLNRSSPSLFFFEFCDKEIIIEVYIPPTISGQRRTGPVAGLDYPHEMRGSKKGDCGEA